MGAPGRAALDLTTIHIGQGGAPHGPDDADGRTDGELHLRRCNTTPTSSTTRRSNGWPSISRRCSAASSPIPAGACRSYRSCTETERRGTGGVERHRGPLRRPRHACTSMVAATARRSPHAIAVIVWRRRVDLRRTRPARRRCWRAGSRASAWDRTASSRSCWTARKTWSSRCWAC